MSVPASVATLPHACKSGHSVHSWPVLILLLIAAIILTSCSGAAAESKDLSGHVLIVGSTALQPLATQAASLFVKAHPDVQMEVRGGGSKVGLVSVNNHQADIGDSDIYADPALYPDPNLTDHLVCVIPFTMITHPGVSITSLKREEIIKIFSTGEITNWNQVGGPNLAIVPVVRPATSGTRDTFRKYILEGRDERGKLLTTDSTDTVRDTVANTPGAIGYIGVPSVDKNVHTIAIDGATPTQANIESGNYLFWGFEHMYTLGDDDPVIDEFLNHFMLAPQAQALALQLGYIPIANVKLAKTDGPALTARAAGSQLDGRTYQ
jgi:phosphate transport system substrate-binding protein